MEPTTTVVVDPGVADAQRAALEERLRSLEARNAALEAASQRLAVEARLAGVRVLDSPGSRAVIAPASRAALADALMGVGVEERGALLEAVAGVQLMPEAVVGFAEGGDGADGRDVPLTSEDRAAIAAEAKRKGVPVAEAERAFVAVRRKRLGLPV